MVLETRSHPNGSPLRPGGEGRGVEDEELLCGWVGATRGAQPPGEGVVRRGGGEGQWGGGDGSRGTQPQGVGRRRARGWELPHIPLCLRMGMAPGALGSVLGWRRDRG